MSIKSSVITTMLFLLTLLASGQERGIVIDTVVCKADPTETYSLYLPSAYVDDGSFGLIFFFEPVARGKVPVTLYKSLADKYNLVFACSNNSRNGPFDKSQKSGYAVINDVFSKFKVNQKLVLLSGFSGGGRAASHLAIKDKQFAGIIACGSAFPPTSSITEARKIPFAEVIGNVDMNYLEALTVFDYLRKLENPNSLVIFPGGHDWPPVEKYEEAVQWHLLQNKKLSETQTQTFYDQRMKYVAERIDSTLWYGAYQQLVQLKSDFKETNYLPSIESALTELEANKEFQKEKKKSDQLRIVERKMRDEFYAHYINHTKNGAPDTAFHETFWKSFRIEIKRMQASKDRLQKETGMRVFDSSWRLCFEQHSVFMEYQQYRQAAMSARIATIFIPEGSRACILTAKAYAMQNRDDEAIKYLKMAIDRGFTKKEIVLSDKAFASLLSNKDFQKLFSKI